VPVYNIEGAARARSPAPRSRTSSSERSGGGTTRLAKINPGVAMPAGDHRRAPVDGSAPRSCGSTTVPDSPEWKQKVGASSSVNWPVGVGGKGNEGVAGLVKQAPGSLGYVELVYALQNKIAYGAVQNQSGEFVTSDVKSVTAAAAGALPTMPGDFRVSITNSPGQGAYPISSFTWILLYEDAQDKPGARLSTS
jgi:phosphate transport system substrate-binding protein